MKTRTSNSRERVLSAAVDIVARDGSSHLTMDAVAAESGLSKGGVLYHFPSKETLLAAMLDHALAGYEQRWQTNQEEHDDSALQAWIRAEQEESPAVRSLAQALLANAAEAPALLEPARVLTKQVLKRIRKESADADLAVLLMYSAEGMRLSSMLDLSPFKPAQRARLSKRLLELAQDL
jgi:AcrR family transcriptional regulator